MFQIREISPERFVIERIESVQVGVFTERALARVALVALNDGGAVEAAEAQEAQEFDEDRWRIERAFDRLMDGEDVTSVAVGTGLDLKRLRDLWAAEQKRMKSDGEPLPEADEDGLDPARIARAFERLRGGESLKHVAMATGLHWRRLRGLWAAEKKRTKSAGEPTPEGADTHDAEAPEKPRLNVGASEEDGRFDEAFQEALSNRLTARQAAEKYGVDYDTLCTELRAERGASS